MDSESGWNVEKAKSSSRRRKGAVQFGDKIVVKNKYARMNTQYKASKSTLDTELLGSSKEAACVNLPSEIWVHIFHKLALKSVWRCKLVCKEWLHLLSDPFFVSNYNSIRNHPVSLFMCCERWAGNIRNDFFKCITTYGDWDGESYRFRGDFFPEGEESRPIVLGSCNGLVALYTFHDDFILFNPCTKEERFVRGRHPWLWDSLRLYGLIHDPVGDEYKVILGIPDSFFVVSLVDGSFEFLDSVADSQALDSACFSSYVMRQTTVRGEPRWGCHDYSEEGLILVFYYDQPTKELRMVEFPKERVPWWRLFELGALDDQLILTLPRDESNDLEVWALNECASPSCQWSMLFVVSTQISGPMQILSRVSDDEILMAWQQCCLFMYNFRNRTLRLLIRRINRNQLVTYIPSLVSPNPNPDPDSDSTICVSQNLMLP